MTTQSELAIKVFDLLWLQINSATSETTNQLDSRSVLSNESTNIRIRNIEKDNNVVVLLEMARKDHKDRRAEPNTSLVFSN